MNGFCPDGYVPTQEAIIRATQSWFPERLAALERAAAPPSETNPDKSPLDPLARALSSLSRPVFPAALELEAKDMINQVVQRLRNLLHQGKLVAYYFENDGRKSVSRDFWATVQADGIMESGTYWPFGKPARWPRCATRITHCDLLRSRVRSEGKERTWLHTESNTVSQSKDNARSSQFQLGARWRTFQIAESIAKRCATCQSLSQSDLTERYVRHKRENGTVKPPHNAGGRHDAASLLDPIKSRQQFRLTDPGNNRGRRARAEILRPRRPNIGICRASC